MINTKLAEQAEEQLEQRLTQTEQMRQEVLDPGRPR